MADHTIPTPGTPLPWKLEVQMQARGKSRRFIRSRVAASGDIAAVLSSGALRRDKADANAAYIVTACNLFPELVEALRKIEMRTAKHADDTMQDQARNSMHANAIARAVLAKAGA